MEVKTVLVLTCIIEIFRCALKHQAAHMQQNCRRAAHMQRVVAGTGNNWHWLAGTFQGGLGIEGGVVRFGRVARCGASKRPGGSYRQA